MATKLINLTFLFLAALLIGANSATIVMAQKTSAAQTFAEDMHSHSNPQAVRVKNVDLDWNVIFDKKILQGTATLTVERATNAAGASTLR